VKKHITEVVAAETNIETAFTYFEQLKKQLTSRYFEEVCAYVFMCVPSKK